MAGVPVGAQPSPITGKRGIDIKIVAPSSVFFGRLENRDEVLKQFGTWEGLAFYERMFRQFPTLFGVCSLWADHTNAIDRAIKPGDPNDETSKQMAADMRRLYRKIRDVHILNKKMLMGRFFGFAATGKADWRKDDETGLLAPAILYDIPQKYIKFGPDWEEYVLTELNPYGYPIPPRTVFYYRWGSTFTPYGEGDLKYCYLPTWYIQNARQFGMQALEILGRPIPWVEVPDTIIGEEYDKLEKGIKAQYKYYVMTRTTSPRMTVTFPSQNVLANGQAGGSELEYIRYHYGEIYICILGTQMTQDKTGGSRALESTRMDVISDKTPPGSQALDQAWTLGWANDIGEVNWPNQPRQLWPLFDSDTSQVNQSAGDAKTMSAAQDVMIKFAANQITQAAALRLLMLAGIPESWANDMVNSTEEEADSLAPVQQQTPTPADQPPPPSNQSVSIPTESGKVLQFGKDAIVPTSRGMKKISELVTGDELVTLREAKG